MSTREWRRVDLLRRLSRYHDLAVSRAEPDLQLPDAHVPPSAKAGEEGLARPTSGAIGGSRYSHPQGVPSRKDCCRTTHCDELSGDRHAIEHD